MFKKVSRPYFIALLALFSLATIFTNCESHAESSCAKACHIIQMYEHGVEDKTLLVTAHAKAGIQCLDCHEQTKEDRQYEEQIYNTGEYDDPLVMREYDADFCLRCHEGYDFLADKTADYEEKWQRNPHKSHLEEPDCYECHRVHRPSVFVCGSCHVADWRERLPAGWSVEK